MNDQPEQEKQRPDPVFKHLVSRAARQYGLRSEPTEIRVQQTSTADLLLIIEPDIDLTDTPFDCFDLFTIFEFKGDGDKLTKAKFALQESRVGLWVSQNRNGNFENVLNVIVTAHDPDDVLKYSEERGLVFKADPARPWLLRGRYGWQNIAIILCRHLPIEMRYEIWLMFAPPTSETWHNFLRMEAHARNLYMLEQAFRLNPKEYKKMSVEIESIMGQYDNAEKERIHQEMLEVAEELLPEFPIEKRLQGLTPSERLEGLKPEERLEGLKPEERLEGLKPEERLEGLKPGERLAGLTPEQLKQLRELLDQQIAPDNSNQNQ